MRASAGSLFVYHAATFANDALIGACYDVLSDANHRAFVGNFRMPDIYVSHCQEKKRLLTRAREERAKTNSFRTHSSQRVPLGVGSCLRRTRHLFAVSGPVGPSQKIEFVFSASPETIRREPRECDLLRSVGQLRDLAVCAPCNPVIFFSHSGGLSRRRSVAFCRHELAFPAIHGQQIRDHLPRYG